VNHIVKIKNEWNYIQGLADNNEDTTKLELDIVSHIPYLLTRLEKAEKALADCEDLLQESKNSLTEPSWKYLNPAILLIRKYFAEEDKE